MDRPGVRTAGLCGLALRDLPDLRFHRKGIRRQHAGGFVGRGPAFYNVHQPLRRKLPGLYAAVYSLHRGGSHDPAGIRLNAENGRHRVDAVLCRVDRGIRRLRLDRYLMMGIDWILFFYSLKPLPSPITHLPLPRHIIQISKRTLERLAYIHVLMLPSCLLW